MCDISRIAFISYHFAFCSTTKTSPFYYVTNQYLSLVIGAVAHGAIDVSYTDELISISEYAMSAAGVSAKFTDAFEELWGIL